MHKKQAQPSQPFCPLPKTTPLLSGIMETGPRHLPESPVRPYVTIRQKHFFYNSEALLRKLDQEPENRL
ncbi:hypothetical protein GmarT_39910 [Gimesia maris]|uniref:Uncharacterized protein n=1 Tax=Gimesia maris TaxID=122 RepID=A0ABX5YQT5_9PLAN|nr:hypothetical protein GmarT_39910 [Gimesia maris]